MSEPSYSIELTRHDPDGGRQVITGDSYGLLRELLDDIERDAAKRGWFEDGQPQRAYPAFCHGDNPPCIGKGYCPRDPSCAE